MLKPLPALISHQLTRYEKGSYTLHKKIEMGAFPW